MYWLHCYFATLNHTDCQLLKIALVKFLFKMP